MGGGGAAGEEVITAVCVCVCLCEDRFRMSCQRSSFNFCGIFKCSCAAGRGLRGHERKCPRSSGRIFKRRTDTLNWRLWW